MELSKWLQETHNSTFELLRHFLSNFFESDLITAPGQMTPALVGAFSVFLPWFPLVVAPLRDKYTYLSQLNSPLPYLRAVRADELWLITLMMSAIGFLTSIKWNVIFPGLRDYRSLAALPVRPYQIFFAKFACLLLVATAVIAVLNTFPSVLFPVVSGGHWAVGRPFAARIFSLGMACILGSYFCLFSIVAIQGVLLALLPGRTFSRLTGYVQGLLVPASLSLVVLSFSIQPRILDLALRPKFAHMLPPVWFLGLCETRLGSQDPIMKALANRAILGLLFSILVSSITYVVAYQRHQGVLLSGPLAPTRAWRWLLTFPERLVSEPRRKAVVMFVVRTLSASSQHRIVLMGYFGFGLAILLSGLVGMRSVVGPDKSAAASFIYAHVVLIIFLLVGARHLFSIPVEVRANWVFQITENEGRTQWLRAVDHFVLVVGSFMLLVIPFPIELRMLGWIALRESILLGIFWLVTFELVFYSWEKLPFTCSVLPGKVPVLIRALQLFAILGFLPIVNASFLASLYRRPLYFSMLSMLAASWAYAHVMRVRARGELRLKYEELPDPAVHSLNLLK